MKGKKPYDNYIVIWKDEQTWDAWKDYCETTGCSVECESIKIYFSLNHVEGVTPSAQKEYGNGMSKSKLNKLCKAIKKIDGCNVYSNESNVYVDCKYNEDEAKAVIDKLGLEIIREYEYVGSSWDGVALYVKEREETK